MELSRLAPKNPQFLPGQHGAAVAHAGLLLKAEAELGGDTAHGLFALCRDGLHRSPCFTKITAGAIHQSSFSM